MKNIEYLKVKGYKRRKFFEEQKWLIGVYSAISLAFLSTPWYYTIADKSNENITRTLLNMIRSNGGSSLVPVYQVGSLLDTIFVLLHVTSLVYVLGYILSSKTNMWLSLAPHLSLLMIKLGLIKTNILLFKVDWIHVALWLVMEVAIVASVWFFDNNFETFLEYEGGR